MTRLVSVPDRMANFAHNKGQSFHLYALTIVPENGAGGVWKTAICLLSCRFHMNNRLQTKTRVVNITHTRSEKYP